VGAVPQVTLVTIIQRLLGKLKFLHNSINHDACPIFYQFVGDAIMEMLIKQRFPLKTVQEEKKNAVRYTAGYVINALLTKIPRSAHPLKNELALCLMEIVEDAPTADMDESEEWTMAIDRGGLKHIDDNTYGVCNNGACMCYASI